MIKFGRLVLKKLIKFGKFVLKNVYFRIVEFKIGVKGCDESELILLIVFKSVTQKTRVQSPASELLN